MNIKDIINKKSNNLSLTKEEIIYVVNNYTGGNINDIDMTAFLKAVCTYGMNAEETFDLTMAMVNSGDTLDTSKMDGILVDKHSTGGIGDKTTLVIAPILASLGLKMIKMSGRGLGYTGGTIDKLEAIEGFKTVMSIDEIINEVNTVGATIVSQSDNLVPADKKIYALRNATNTANSIPLIAASIMSKKIAIGANTILLDIKVGSGAFMTNLDDARALAKLMIEIGHKFNKKVIAVLTDMNNPLGNNIGNGLEVKEALDILRGTGNKELFDLCINLASILYGHSTNTDINISKEKVLEVINNNKAYQKFLEIVNYQGGKINNLKDAKYTYEIKSNQNGYIKNINALIVGQIAKGLGAGRINKDDVIDYTAGIVITKNRGTYVNQGEVMGLLKTSLEIKLDQFEKQYLESLIFSETPVIINDLIYEVII